MNPRPDDAAGMRLSALHLGGAGSVVAEFMGSSSGWAEFGVDRGGAVPVASPHRPERCPSCGTDLSQELFENGSSFESRFETAADLRAVIGEVLSFQSHMVHVVASSVPELRELTDHLRHRIGMLLITHHYATVSALVEGRLTGHVERELVWCFSRWMSRELTCARSNIAWSSQVAEVAAPGWRARPRTAGTGFLDLTHEESRAATDLLLNSLDRFCEFAEGWASATGLAVDQDDPPRRT